MKFLKSFFEELEKPRSERPLGSGWLSGSLSVLCGLVSMALVLIFRQPDLFLSPELSPIHDLFPLQSGIHAFLIFGYSLATLSLILSSRKILSATGFFLVVLASLLYGPSQGSTLNINTSLYFGLDFFVLKILTVGLLFLPLERLFPHKEDQTVLRYAWREDFFYFAVSSLLVQILNYLTLAPSEFVINNFDVTEIRHHIFDLPILVQVFLIMLATDFIQYWLHYAFHKVPFLWRFHSIHHSAENMDWLAGARMHFFEITILRAVTAVPMLTLGFDPAAIQLYLVFVYFYSAFVHANIGWNFKAIERFVVTPRFHHWHHGSEKEALDVNFAVHFPIFDWLFGTFHLPEDRWPKKYGVHGEVMPRGYFRQFLHPFRRKSKPQVENLD